MYNVNLLLTKDILKSTPYSFSRIMSFNCYKNHQESGGVSECHWSAMKVSMGNKRSLCRYLQKFTTRSIMEQDDEESLQNNIPIKKPRTNAKKRLERLASQEDLSHDRFVQETIEYCKSIAGKEKHFDEEAEEKAARKAFYPKMTDKSNILKKAKDSRLKSTARPRASKMKKIGAELSKSELYLIFPEKTTNQLRFMIYESLKKIDETNLAIVILRNPNDPLGCTCTCKHSKTSGHCKHKLFVFKELEFPIDGSDPDADDIAIETHLNQYEYEELMNRFTRLKKNGFQKLIKTPHKRNINFFLSLNGTSMKRCAFCNKKLLRETF
jgi:hypothetical protein